MELVGNFLDGVLLTVYICLLITILWQWLEKKIAGKRTYIFWHDVVAIVCSVGIAIVLLLFQDVVIVELFIALITMIAQLTIVVLIWKVMIELFGLRKINKLLKQQIEVKDQQIKTQRMTIDELFRILKEENKAK